LAKVIYLVFGQIHYMVDELAALVTELYVLYDSKKRELNKNYKPFFAEKERLEFLKGQIEWFQKLIIGAVQPDNIPENEEEREEFIKVYVGYANDISEKIVSINTRSEEYC